MNALVSLAIAGLLVGPADGEPRTSTAEPVAATAKDYSYVDCKIDNWWIDDAKLVTKVQLNCGTNDGVYVGSTGLIYLGDEAKKFVEVGGKRVRFRVLKVHDDSAVATIYQAPLFDSELRDNRRVILRARKHGEKPGAVKDYTFAECKVTGYRRDNKYATRVEELDLACGKNDRVYVGSTGLIFLGDEKKKFVEFGGKRVRFVVQTVGDESATAKIIQAHPAPGTVEANRRALLRVKKAESRPR